MQNTMMVVMSFRIPFLNEWRTHIYQRMAYTYLSTNGVHISINEWRTHIYQGDSCGLLV
jgi:hypothetical protein